MTIPFCCASRCLRKWNTMPLTQPVETCWNIFWKNRHTTEHMDVSRLSLALEWTVMCAGHSFKHQRARLCTLQPCLLKDGLLQSFDKRPVPACTPKLFGGYVMLKIASSTESCYSGTVHLILFCHWHHSRNWSGYICVPRLEAPLLLSWAYAIELRVRREEGTHQNQPSKSLYQAIACSACP